jgi:hypothetical protein
MPPAYALHVPLTRRFSTAAVHQRDAAVDRRIRKRDAARARLRRAPAVVLAGAAALAVSRWPAQSRLSQTAGSIRGLTESFFGAGVDVEVASLA